MSSYFKETVYYPKSQSIDSGENKTLIIFDGKNPPEKIDLEKYRNARITFGRDLSCDLVLKSDLASKHHGTISWKNGKILITDNESSANGILWNNMLVRQCILGREDIIRIDAQSESVAQGVLFLLDERSESEGWKIFKLNEKKEVQIGRKKDSDICLKHISVSMYHAQIKLEAGQYCLYDRNSTNGIYVNGRKISGKTVLHEKDVITITNSKLIFTSEQIYYCTFIKGISIEARHVTRKVGKGKREKVICNDVSLSVGSGELVAIIGGSGAGKTTLMEAISGYAKPSSGQVLISGGDLYQMYDAFKNIIGYVPQKDIVYDGLTLNSMLDYASRLRLPDDIPEKERVRRIHEVLDTVGLNGHEETIIGRLSGGQRKRASIAIELLSDPELLFLDEPASGLDPGTERSLMNTLRKMVDMGKTIVLVTHSTLNLQICDKILFMGSGGNLCCCGNEEEAKAFFHVKSLVDIYDLINTDSGKWKERYATYVGERETVQEIGRIKKKKNRNRNSRIKQIRILSERYFKIILNDKKRLMLVLMQAPLLAFLISLVADGEQFKSYSATKSLLFALSCAAFWIGILNAIQEVCKERHILKREYMTGLHLSSYIFSKFSILGILCMVQSVLLLGIFGLLVGFPSKKLFLEPALELLITTFITSFSAMAIGIFVSSLFKNPDRAMTVAPILLLPQILFSGLLFKLSGATKYISWFVTCRWSMEGYGTTANLNGLKYMVNLNGKMMESAHEAEEYFEFTKQHLLQSWMIMAGFAVFFGICSILILRNIRKRD